MTDGVAVIGLGNAMRRDDGVGPAVASAVEACAIPGVRVVTDAVDPIRIIDAWAGASLAIVVDAAVTSTPVPGRIHRCTGAQVSSAPTMSSHGMSLPAVLALGEALDRVPQTLVLFAVEAADTGYGEGLTPDVAAAVPCAAAAVAEEIARGSFGRDGGAQMPWPGDAR